MGGANIICSDKTGTLTKNEMTVVAGRTSDFLYKVSQVGYNPANGTVSVDSDQASSSPDDSKDVALDQLIISGLLCNDSRLDRVDGNVVPVGDPTEVALVTFAEKRGVLAQDIRTAQPGKGMIPFESGKFFLGFITVRILF
jgi:Ca2+-transporting ATPase